MSQFYNFYAGLHSGNRRFMSNGADVFAPSEWDLCIRHNPQLAIYSEGRRFKLMHYAAFSLGMTPMV